MERKVALGIQDFSQMIEHNCFYVDKTKFIEEWWENLDAATLIARPRRFGKSLTMSMVEQFFSINYANSKLFSGFYIWKKEKYRAMQGTYPVIALSFSDIEKTSFAQARRAICDVIKRAYKRFKFLLYSDLLDEDEKQEFRGISVCMDDYQASSSLRNLSEYLCRYYGKRVIILLDEYDAPMQTAYVNGYWDALVSFIRDLLSSTFENNPYLERAILTGITRISKDSLFSGLKNLEVVTMTSKKYEDIFGFTEDEVFHALDEYNLSDKKAEVKRWYDGYTFGNAINVYNPWSIINYLGKREFGLYWVHTSSDTLINNLVKDGRESIQIAVKELMQGRPITTFIDEALIYNQLDMNENAIWSLLLATGYLKIISYESYNSNPNLISPSYQLALTNHEVELMFRAMVLRWFANAQNSYGEFIDALLAGELEAMNTSINSVTKASFSSFDIANSNSEFTQPEKFYHGFVIGLVASLKDRYFIASNGESGEGRYDVMLEPLQKNDNAIIIEFKVFHSKKYKNLEEAADSGLQQIEDRHYDAQLKAKGMSDYQIKKYAFAFKGKEVLIKSSDESRNGALLQSLPLIEQ